MRRQLIVRAEAEADLAEARDWYEARQPGLGVKFVDAVDDLFDRIRPTPELYAAGYRDVRPAKLSRFPHVVHYRATATTVDVIGVIHGRRRAKEWRSCL